MTKNNHKNEKTSILRKVTVFGADGRTGVEVVKELIENNFDVTAFVYSDASAQYVPSGVRVVVGDVMNEANVDKAVAGTDAVISVIGHIKDSDPFMQTKGMKNIVSAMKYHHVQRIVSLTGTGVREKGDTPSLLDRLGNMFISLIDKERIIDGIEHAKVLKESGLDWSIVRVLKLTNGPVTETFSLTAHGPAESSTSRKKVAKILVALVRNRDWINKSPVSSK